MIYTTAKVTVKNNVATLDKPIILYKGDKNVEIQFLLIDRAFLEYTVTDTNIITDLDASKGQLIILKPDGQPEFSDITDTKDGKIIFTVPDTLIDQDSEVGTFTFQIRLFNQELTSRVTLPPCYDGFKVEQPIAQD